jgi:hypothetical protein
MKVAKLTDRLLRPTAKFWRDKWWAMKHVGIERLRSFAKRYNQWRYSDRVQAHHDAFENGFKALLRENGSLATFPPRIELRDGWARDDSQSLPHLGRVLDQATEIVRERGGKQHSGTQQPFFRSLLFPGDFEKYPAILDFILSSELLGVAGQHLGTVPVLSKTLPPGVRFMESNAALDPDWAGPFRESQLYHLDIHDTPLVYVLVLVDDVTDESGPWTFLPASVSSRAKAALRYQQPGTEYRVTDEQIYSVIDSREAISFTGKRGSVLFIDSSACFHYGSRRSIRPRFQLMYALTTPCRCDIFQTQFENKYPMPPDASRLRRMVTEPWM